MGDAGVVSLTTEPVVEEAAETDGDLPLSCAFASGTCDAGGARTLSGSAAAAASAPPRGSKDMLLRRCTDELVGRGMAESNKGEVSDTASCVSTMTPASRMQAATNAFNPELWPCWNKHSSCRARVRELECSP